MFSTLAFDSSAIYTERLNALVVMTNVSTVLPHNKEVLGSIPRWGFPSLFCEVFACTSFFHILPSSRYVILVLVLDR